MLRISYHELQVIGSLALGALSAGVLALMALYNSRRRPWLVEFLEPKIGWEQSQRRAARFWSRVSVLLLVALVVVFLWALVHA